MHRALLAFNSGPLRARRPALSPEPARGPPTGDENRAPDDTEA